MLLDDALAGLELVTRFAGPIIDVGSGGGTPGIPLAFSLPDRQVTLLEAERRKTEFLQGWTGELPNLRVVWGRAEEQPTEAYGVAVAKALAQPDGRGRVVPATGRGRRSSRPVGRTVGGRGRCLAGRGAGRRRARGVAARLPRAPEDRADAARLPAPHRGGEEAPARLAVDPEPLLVHCSH